MNKQKLFWMIAAGWLVVIGGFILMKEYTLRTGTEILLKTRPVDPRDLFRGDYVILRYDISTICLNTVPADVTQVMAGDTVYVGLHNQEGFGVVSKVYKNSLPEGLFIKGRVMEVSGSELTVEYGIESYFVPEGEGREIERQLTDIAVRVVVDRQGRALIKTLLRNGQQLTLN